MQGNGVVRFFHRKHKCYITGEGSFIGKYSHLTDVEESQNERGEHTIVDQVLENLEDDIELALAEGDDVSSPATMLQPHVTSEFVDAEVTVKQQPPAMKFGGRSVRDYVVSEEGKCLCNLGKSFCANAYKPFSLSQFISVRRAGVVLCLVKHQLHQTHSGRLRSLAILLVVSRTLNK